MKRQFRVTNGRAMLASALRSMWSLDRKSRILSLLALMIMAVSGAWAQEWTNIIVNSDMEGTDVSCFYVHEQAGGMYLARITDGIGVDGSRAIKLQSSDNETNSWDTQFNMRLPYVLPAGTQYKLSFDYKSDQIAVQDGDNDGTFGFQVSNEPGQYVWWTISGWPPPSLSVSESDVNKWLHFEETYTVPAELNGTTQSDQGDWLLAFRTIYVNLSGNKVATEVIFDNVKVEILNSVLNTLTPEPVTDPNLLIPAPPYTVKLAEGTEDAAKWTITPAEATTDGVHAGTEVKATYNGTKRVKSVKAVVTGAAPAAEAATIYSWESPAGTVSQTGGTIEYVNGDTSGGDRVNYLHIETNNYTICLNGKKNNITDGTASQNAGRMDVTLDEALAAGDVITITAYIYKDESKQSSAYIIFNGANGFDSSYMSVYAESAAYGDNENLYSSFNGSPKTVTVTVPAEAAGCKSFSMTRGVTGTNLFITKMTITRGEANN